MEIIEGQQLTGNQRRVIDLQEAGFDPHIEIILKYSRDIGALEVLESVKKVARKHDAFQLFFRRTNYALYPLQIVSGEPEIDIQEEIITGPNGVADFVRNLPKGSHIGEAGENVIRIWILKGNAIEKYLVIRFSSMRMDAKSVLIFSKELNSCFTGRSLQSDEPVQLTQYVDWEYDLLQSADNEKDISFWKNPDFGPQRDLKNFPFFLLKPDARGRYELSWKLIDIDGDALNKLTYLVGNGDIFKGESFFLSMWAMLLRYYTNSTNIQIGIIENERSYPEFNGIVGPISKLLPFVADLSAVNVLSDLVQTVSKSVERISQLQEYLDLTAIGGLKRGGLSHYDFGFEYLEIEDDQRAPFAIADLKNQTEPFVLKLECFKRYNKYQFRLQYMSAFLAEGGVDTVATHFGDLIRHVASNGISNQPIAFQGYFTSKALSGVTEERRGNITGNRRFRSVIEAFEQNALDDPSKIVLRSVNRSLTYREVNEMTCRIANYISRRYNIGPGSLVALDIADNISQVIYILASLKTGAAFLPLNTAAPADRIRLILTDSKPGLLITDCREEVFDLSRTLHLNVVEQSIGLENETFRSAPVMPGDPVYVIYTSGSTGMPKGVVISHASLLNYTDWFVSQFNIGPSDNTVLLSSLSFDLGYTSFWPALVGGSEILTLKNSDSYDIDECMSLIELGSVRYLKMTPSHFHLIMSDEEYFNILLKSDVRLIVLGGEKIMADDLVRFFTRKDDVVFVNHYGPTETTIGTIFQPVTSHNLATFIQRPVIGRPIDNADVYILDSEGLSTPVGMSGEICISGKGLANGYFNNDGLTREKFVRLDQLSGALVYKTGDLGRFLPDGSIEFLGRNDDQVKINGYRVELEEIEQILAQHPKVRRAAVVYVGDAQEHKLMAYLECDEKLAVAEIRNLLRQRLPEYMVPGQFYFLNKFVYKANGKIDKSVLKVNSSAAIDDDASTDYVGATDELEEKLMQVWQQILGSERIGVLDDFYALGGDSIKALQIISRLHRLGLKLQIRDILEGGHVRGVATRVTELFNFFPQHEINGDVPLTPIQKEFFQKITNNPNHFNQCSLIGKDRFDDGLVEKVFEKLLRHHDILRARFLKSEEGYNQVCTPYPDVHLDLRSYECTSFEDMERVFYENATKIQAGVNIHHGPLIRLGLFSAPEQSWLLIVIHHLLVDGVSWRILLEDFQLLYQQALRSEPLQLPFKTTSYKDWSERLQQYSGETMGQHVEYWNKVVSPPVLKVPCDFSESPATVADDLTHHLQLTEEETTYLVQQSQAVSGFTYEEILVAALYQAIYRTLGIEDILIDVEKHGRESIFPEVDISRTVGWFTVRFPMRVKQMSSLDDMQLMTQVSACIRAAATSGFTYGVIKYLMADSPGKVHAIKSIHPEICFNNLGEFGSTVNSSDIMVLNRDKGLTADPKTNKRYKLEITTSIFDGRLNIYIRYSVKQYKADTILLILADYKTAILTFNNFFGHGRLQDPRQRFYLSDFSDDEIASLLS